MSLEIYEIPENFNELFKEVAENGGFMSYRIIDYNEGMDMDNVDSLRYFIENVGASVDWVLEDLLGTQIIISHPNYQKRIIIDSGGLGDFYSHGFECRWEEE